ncbi:hypothetical protein F5Y17DRAFT_387386 [Xylariaceae sp. FL0594]|nr:hypothetical protein F5Y17DRAFT_387386 [Xylariaceae sp. FL0594]
MPWATNPLFGSPSQDPNEKPRVDPEAATVAGDEGREVGVGGRGSGSTSPDPLPSVKGDDYGSKIRPPTSKFTAHQIFYIFILDGIGAAIVSGGINFAIAYGLYHGRGGPKSPIRLFQFPNTLAGDTAVTIFVQFLITWVIESVVVNLDIRKGAIPPVGFIPEPRGKLLRWYMMLDRQEQTCDVRSVKHWLEFLLSQAIRALLLAVVCFPAIFGISVGFLVLIGKRHDQDWDWYYSATWAPEIFKLVQGAVLGLLFTPLMVLFWLARCGWALKKNEARPS